MSRWDIYWAEVQFEDSDEVKMRPVVLLNETAVFIIGFGVYSASPRPMMNDYSIRDWEIAGLDHKSTVHLDRLVKIEKNSIHKKIGRLSKRDILLIERQIY